MEFKVLLTTFLLVFLAELGDKTQLATLVLSSNNQSKLAVFIGSAGALVLCSLIAVLAGTALGKWIPDHYIKVGAGVAFIVVGLWTLISAILGARA
jgi:Ca2+/H+ antiporter, TMEM165/GDT1 family